MSPSDDLMTKLLWFERNLDELLTVVQVVRAALQRANISDADALLVLEALRTGKVAR